MTETLNLDSLVGRRIEAVDQGDYPVLHFDDGSSVEFEGGGYDGHGTWVMWEITSRVEPVPPEPGEPDG